MKGVNSMNGVNKVGVNGVNETLQLLAGAAWWKGALQKRFGQLPENVKTGHQRVYTKPDPN